MEGHIFWGAKRLREEVWGHCGNVPVNNNANCFLFQLALTKKSVVIIYTSQSIKPLHLAVGSPMNPHYGGLVWKPVWPLFLFNNVRVTIKKKILLSSRLQRKSVLQLVPWFQLNLKYLHVKITKLLPVVV